MSASNQKGSETASVGEIRTQGRRQQRSLEEKRRIAEAALQRGASVSAVAQANGVHTTQVYKWRCMYQRGLLDGSQAAELLAVRVSDARAEEKRSARARSSARAEAGRPGAIRIELAGARVSIEGRADAATVRVVLECLAG